VGYNTAILVAWQLGAVQPQPTAGYLVLGTATGLWPYHSVVLALVPMGYAVWGLYLYASYRRRLPHAASNNTARRWLGFLVWGFVGYFIAIFIAVTLADPPLAAIPPQYTFYIVSALVMLFILLLGYVGLKQPTVFVQVNIPQPVPAAKPAEATPTPKYAKSGLGQQQVAAYKAQLHQQMETHQYHLQPNLTLATLASATALHPTYLSQVINQGFGLNFYDFVNTYRIGQAKRLLASPRHAHLTVLAIGLDCGFQSKSTFNKAFKKATGTTPSAYRTAHAGKAQ